MSLESALETRYFADEDRLSRLLKASIAVFQTLPATSSSDTAAAHQTFNTELQSFELGVGKAAVVLETNLRERQEYQISLAEAAKSIEIHRAEIESLKQTLSLERTQRRCKEEYDQLSQVISALPPREQTEKQIAELLAELDALANEKAAIDTETAAKAKQTFLFATALDQLKSAAPNMISDIANAGTQINEMQVD